MFREFKYADNICDILRDYPSTVECLADLRNCIAPPNAHALRSYLTQQAIVQIKRKVLIDGRWK